MDKKIIQKAGKYFTETEKHLIIQELISSGCTKAEIWSKIYLKKKPKKNS
jgi:hypothetical protein